MNAIDLPPYGPGNSLTNLSEDQADAQLTRQMGRWRTHGLDPAWYKLLSWWVLTRKDEFEHWRQQYAWKDIYWPAGGDLDYKAWFRAEDWPDREVYHLLDVALHMRKLAEENPAEGPHPHLHEYRSPAGGPVIQKDSLKSKNLYLIESNSLFRAHT